MRILRWLLLLLLIPSVLYAGWTSEPVQVNSWESGLDPHVNSGNRRIVRVGNTVITLCPANGDHDYTFRSTDGGASWSSIDTDGYYSGVLVLGKDDYVYHFYRYDTAVYMVKFLYNGTPAAPVTIVTGMGGTAVGVYRSVAATVDSTGKLYVFYHHNAGGSYDNIYVTSSSDSGTTWSDPIIVVAHGGVAKYYPRADVDLSNNLVVTYQGWSSNSPSFTKSTDGGVTWGTPYVFYAGSDNKSNPDILVAATNTYYVFCQSYSPYGTGFYKTTDGGTNWSAFQLIEAAVSTGYGDPSSALGSDGTVYVAYRNDSLGGSGVWEERISSSSNGGTSWSDVYRYDGAYRMGTRSHLRYQTWFNHGGQLDWAWMQYSDAAGTNKTVYFNTNSDVTIYQTDSTSVPILTDVRIIGGTVQ